MEDSTISKHCVRIVEVSGKAGRVCETGRGHSQGGLKKEKGPGKSHHPAGSPWEPMVEGPGWPKCLPCLLDPRPPAPVSCAALRGWDNSLEPGSLEGPAITLPPKQRPTNHQGLLGLKLWSQQDIQSICEPRARPQLARTVTASKCDVRETGRVLLPQIIHDICKDPTTTASSLWIHSTTVRLQECPPHGGSDTVA